MPSSPDSSESPQIKLSIGCFGHLVSLEETKESLVSRLGQPDGDSGNGCCTAWPDIFVYDRYELHFKHGQLKRIKDLRNQSTLLP